MFCHEYVPAGFGYETVIPLIKDKVYNLNDANNYRPILHVSQLSPKSFWMHITGDISRLING